MKTYDPLNRSIGEGTADWRDATITARVDTVYGSDIPLDEAMHQGIRALEGAFVAWGFDTQDVHAAVVREVGDVDVYQATIEAVLMEHQADGRTSAGATEKGWATLCSCGYTASDMAAHQTERIAAALRDAGEGW